ncbi:MAG: pentapeptide repeat-containing protein [Flavitalea sp.]
MSKKCFILLIIVFAISLSAKNQIIDPAITSLQKQKDSLEIRKLHLEVKQLEDSSRNFNTSQALTVLGSILGLLTIIWSIYQGVKTIKIQTEQQKQNRISQLLESLSDATVEKRASAANGLSRYPTEVYMEVLFTLKIEQTEYVREMLEEILIKLPDTEFASVISANRDTLINRSKLLGSLGVTGEKIETTEALLGIEPDTRLNITSSFRYFYDQGQETARYQLYRASQLANIKMDIKDGLITESLQAARVAYSTSKIIAKRISLGHYYKDLTKMDLNLANLYKTNLAECDFYKSIVTNSIFRHSNLAKCNFEESNFNKSDLFDCNLEYAKIRSSSFNSASLRKSKGEHSEVSKSFFIGSVLSQSIYNHSTFNDVNFKNSKIKGTELKNCLIQKAGFNASELDGSNFENSTIEDSTFFGAELRAVVFTNCILMNVSFNGSNLQNAFFTNCTLTNVDFSGATLKNIKTENWKLINCNLLKAKEYNPQIQNDPEK